MLSLTEPPTSVFAMINRLRTITSPTLRKHKFYRPILSIEKIHLLLYSIYMTYLSSNILDTSYAQALLDRFLRYAQVYSQSDSLSADQGNQPSTPQQWDFAHSLETELLSLGLEDVQVTDFCYVYGRLPASKGCEDVPSFCLLSHIDTVEDVSGLNVKPLVHKNYDGKKIVLPYGNVLDPSKDKPLYEAGQIGDTVITSDGNTLLGADDKAGVAEIVTCLEFLKNHPEINHGQIEVIFSPDEETGHGMDNVPTSLLKSKHAYTVDGGHEGELETECFNAFKSEVTFFGNSIHPGSGRPDFVNAVFMASSFVQSLPHTQLPETTDNRQGFFGAMSIEGSIEKAKVELILRDFDLEGIEKRKSLVDMIAQTVAATYGGKTEVVHTQQYLNMKGVLDKHPKVVENLVEAYQKAGVKVDFVPIRGGTDGSRLTEMGVPTPNIFTGGHNFHSRNEWASLSQMIKATEVLIQLAQEN